MPITLPGGQHSQLTLSVPAALTDWKQLRAFASLHLFHQLAEASGGGRKSRGLTIFQVLKLLSLKRNTFQEGSVAIGIAWSKGRQDICGSQPRGPQGGEGSSISVSLPSNGHTASQPETFMNCQLTIPGTQCLETWPSSCPKEWHGEVPREAPGWFISSFQAPVFWRGEKCRWVKHQDSTYSIPRPRNLHMVIFISTETGCSAVLPGEQHSTNAQRSPSCPEGCRITEKQSSLLNLLRFTNSWFTKSKSLAIKSQVMHFLPLPHSILVL